MHNFHSLWYSCVYIVSSCYFTQLSECVLFYINQYTLQWLKKRQNLASFCFIAFYFFITYLYYRDYNFIEINKPEMKVFHLNLFAWNLFCLKFDFFNQFCSSSIRSSVIKFFDKLTWKLRILSKNSWLNCF